MIKPGLAKETGFAARGIGENPDELEIGEVQNDGQKAPIRMLRAGGGRFGTQTGEIFGPHGNPPQNGLQRLPTTLMSASPFAVQICAQAMPQSGPGRARGRRTRDAIDGSSGPRELTAAAGRHRQRCGLAAAPTGSPGSHPANGPAANSASGSAWPQFCRREAARQL